mgnify:CR=1 FL=1
MQVVFRVDASVEIGYGHVMRCLTLADELRSHNHQVSFVCRDLTGHLAGKIEQKSYVCQLIQAKQWQQDASQTAGLLAELSPDWIVVDHYQLDAQWHKALRGITGKIMVVDDLANRRLDCDLLLDTGMGKQPQDYERLVPTGCHLLTGVQYALIRREFIRKVNAAKTKRLNIHKMEKVLINFGGMDPAGLIPAILGRLINKFSGLEFSVVVSSKTPNLADIQQLVQGCTSCRLLLDIDNMAEEMLLADFAIGAAGITAYERCTLGLPAIVIPNADNQQHFMSQLDKHSAVMAVRQPERMLVEIEQLMDKCLKDADSLKNFSVACFKLVDGLGAHRVVEAMDALA